jgi:hypothetical protein
MSLAETQQIVADLQEIMQMLNTAETKVDDVTEKVTGKSSKNSRGYSFTEDKVSLRREMYTMNMYMVAIQRMTGSDEISGMINKIQSAIATAMRLRMLLLSIQTIQTAMAMGNALTPWGIAMVGANAIGLGISLSTLGQ